MISWQHRMHMESSSVPHHRNECVYSDTSTCDPNSVRPSPGYTKKKSQYTYLIPRIQFVTLASEPKPPLGYALEIFKGEASWWRRLFPHDHLDSGALTCCSQSSFHQFQLFTRLGYLALTLGQLASESSNTSFQLSNVLRHVCLPIQRFDNTRRHHNQ